MLVLLAAGLIGSIAGRGDAGATAGALTNWAPRIDRYVNVSTMAASRDEVLVGGSLSKTFG